uniref:Nonstructural protein n=1 Tax=Massilia virus TaxID=391640 RepID=A0A0S2RS07_9VIRU|nr:nonstructural protein [Massilia virus]
MFSRVVYLRKRSSDRRKGRTQRRYCVDSFLNETALFGPISLAGREVPSTVYKNSVVFDSRPTLNHYLLKNEFPAILSGEMINLQSTTLYNPIMRELYQESIHQIKRSNRDYLVSALRWPTGLASLEFIDFYFEDFIFLSVTDSYATNKLLKLLMKASGDQSCDIEKQIKIIYRKVLLEGSKFGMNCYHLTGADIIRDICIIQSARVAKLAQKTQKSPSRDVVRMIYQSLSPNDLLVSPKQPGVDTEASKLAGMSAEESFDYFMAENVEFRAMALSTFWTRDWPTAAETLTSLGQKSKRGSRSTQLHCQFPLITHPSNYPPN